MKMSRRILTVVVCLALLLNFSSPAFAAASRTFFIRNAYGYSCTGSGSISGTTGKAVFNATSLPATQTIPPAACTCTVWVYAYDQNGNILSAVMDNEGTVSATAECRTQASIYRIQCTYTFNDTDLGLYSLYNS